VPEFIEKRPDAMYNVRQSLAQDLQEQMHALLIIKQLLQKDETVRFFSQPVMTLYASLKDDSNPHLQRTLQKCVDQMKQHPLPWEPKMVL